MSAYDAIPRAIDAANRIAVTSGRRQRVEVRSVLGGVPLLVIDEVRRPSWRERLIDWLARA